MKEAFWILVVFLICIMWIDDKSKCMDALKEKDHQIEIRDSVNEINRINDSIEKNSYDVAKEIRKSSGQPGNYTEQ